MSWYRIALMKSLQESTLCLFVAHTEGVMRSFWQIVGDFAFSSKGETIQKLDENFSVSSRGTTYMTNGDTTVGSDGKVFVQMDDFSSDGSTRMGDVATGIGAIFNEEDDKF